jgi:hypothetical protein
MDNNQRTEGMGNWKFTVYNPEGAKAKTAKGVLKMDGKVYTVVEVEVDQYNIEQVTKTLLVVPAQNVAFVENAD